MGQSNRYRFVCICLMLLALFSLRLYAVDNGMSVEYLDYYEKALDNQRKAFNICVLELKRVSAQEPEKKEEVDDVKKKQDSLIRLRKHFINKIINTTKKLAMEHEKLALKLNEKGENEDSLVHISDSAQRWEEVAEVYEQEANYILNDAEYYDAAGLNEAAYNSYKSSQDKWNKFISLSNSLKMVIRKNVDEKMRSLYFAGLEALRTAMNLYQQASYKHARIANGEKVEVSTISPAIGADWEKAGQASESYERLTDLTEKLEEKMFEDYSLQY